MLKGGHHNHVKIKIAEEDNVLIECQWRLDTNARVMVANSVDVVDKGEILVSMTVRGDKDVLLGKGIGRFRGYQSKERVQNYYR